MNAETESDEPARRTGQAEGIAWVVRLTGIGFEFAALILLGWYLDRAWGIRPWGVLLGVTCGIVAMCLHLIRLAPGRGRGSKGDASPPRGSAGRDRNRN